MRVSLLLSNSPCIGTKQQRRRLWRAAVALALAVPHAAHPYSLEQLLSVPLEHLLRLEVSPRRVSSVCDQPRGGGAPAASRGTYEA